ncbi:MAG: Cna B-type domain-containing protein [Clostridia bacterium]|nr:Cna B-type domain-containing protein [Clostridia bacterium]
MKSFLKRILSLTLAVMMLAALVPTALADGSDVSDMPSEPIADKSAVKETEKASESSEMKEEIRPAKQESEEKTSTAEEAKAEDVADRAESKPASSEIAAAAEEKKAENAEIKEADSVKVNEASIREEKEEEQAASEAVEEAGDKEIADLSEALKEEKAEESAAEASGADTDKNAEELSEVKEEIAEALPEALETEEEETFKDAEEEETKLVPVFYTITWKNADGTVLMTKEVEEGIIPSYTGAVPEKAASAKCRYQFKGWTPAVKEADSDQVYTAVFSEMYLITWTNWDGSVLKEEYAAKGSIPAYSGETPVRESAESDKNYYVFSKFTPNVVSVSGDKTYTAAYDTLSKGSIVVAITGIYDATVSAVGGKAVPATKYVSFTASNQTKLISGFFSYVGGKNRTASGIGANYKFLNAFTLAGGSSEISKIAFRCNKSSGGVNEATVYFTDGSTRLFTEDENGDLRISISPVYEVTQNWYLNYRYIDNVSTGSGSWSNLDSASSFTHTFSDPSKKTPVSHYRFVHWYNTDDGSIYTAGRSFTYDGADQAPGSTKTITFLAKWQPSVTVNWYVKGTLAHSEEQFKSGISVYSYEPSLTKEESKADISFKGWYNEKGELLSKGFEYKLPAVTSNANTAKEYNVYAKYTTSFSVRKVWNDADDKDGIRPGSVSVQLLANGKPVKGRTAVLSEANGWSYTFSGLDAYAADQLIRYSADETEVADGYEKAVASDGANRAVITNSHVPASLYTVNHYLENADTDGYTLAEKKEESALTGKAISVDANSYEGFRYNEAASISDGTVALDDSLVLNLYYDRNQYTVSYEYSGKVPSGASELPEATARKFGSKVVIAENAVAKGYTFSGWDSETFTMPAQDVTIHGSFTAETKKDTPTKKSTTTTIADEEVPLGMIGSMSFILTSDTDLTAGGKQAEAYQAMIRYLKENRFLGASALIGTGNAVADGKDEAAWKLIRDALDGMNRKNGELPYLNIAGCNEVGADADYTDYLSNGIFEAAKRNSNGSVWVHPFADNQVLMVGIGSQKVLDGNATDEERSAQQAWIQYVNDMLAAYSEYTVILLVNDFIEKNPADTLDHGTLTAFGKLVESEIVAVNSNVSLILSGNAEGAARWSKAYEDGRSANAIMYNYASDVENGLGFFRMITLNAEAGTIAVATYSPVLDRDSYDEAHPEYDFFTIENAF